LLNFQFVPTIESEAVSNRLLPAHPNILIKSASPVPLISGVNNMEGMIVFGGKLFLIILSNQWPYFLTYKIDEYM